MREGMSAPTASACAWLPSATACAANSSADTPATHTPCDDSVCIGGAASSPWIMLAKPGISASPPDEPTASRDTSPSVARDD